MILIQGHTQLFSKSNTMKAWNQGFNKWSVTIIAAPFVCICLQFPVTSRIATKLQFKTLHGTIQVMFNGCKISIIIIPKTKLYDFSMEARSPQEKDHSLLHW